MSNEASKRKWIVLRGLARGVGHWGSFKDLLQQRFIEDEFEFLELPGNGARHKEQSPLRIADYTKDLRSRSKFIAAREKVHILSVSMGGMITIEWMRQFPQDVAKAYIICTSSRNDAVFYKRFQLVNLWTSRRLWGPAEDPLLWERTILDMVANSHDQKQKELEAMEAVSRQYPMRRSNVVRQLFAASQYSFPEKAPGDIQLIGSYGDKLVAPECTLNIARRWGLEATMHPWAGHDISIDDPHWVLEQLV